MFSLKVYIENDININTKITNLEERINIDYDIISLLDSLNYDNITKILTINFVSNLTKDERKIMDTLININIFDKIPGFDILVPQENYERRLSVFINDPPTTKHDICSGYVEGSIVINNNIPYMCTDNTKNNAIWSILSTRQQDKNNVGRNWLFTNSSSGTVIGLEITLRKPNNQGLIERILFNKFQKEYDGDTIYGLKFLIYSQQTFDLAITIDECPNDVNGQYTQIYPRSGIDQILNINGTPRLVGETRIIEGGGNKSMNKCPNCIDFTFDPPIIINECSIAMYLSSVSMNGPNNFVIGIWQLSVKTSND